VAFTGALAVLVGTLGFNPTDEGLVLSYGYRILHGEIPHLDFISPRPIGSSVLHLVDFLIPGPLLLTSRVIALCEMTAIALLFGALVFRSAPARWNTWQISLVVIALIVDLHTFPLMAWYTIDGVLLSLAGFVLLRTADAGRGRRCMGLLLCGLALTTKQSFFAAPVAATLIAAWPCLRIGRTAFVRRFVSSALISALPVTLMVVVLVGLGAGPAMRTQLLNAGVVNFFAVLGPSALWMLSVGAVVIGAVLMARTSRWSARAQAARLRQWSSSALVGVILVILVTGGLTSDGEWGDQLFTVLLAYVVVDLVLTRHLDIDVALVLALGWMASLSWGYAVADLCAGAIVLTIAWRAWMLAGDGFAFGLRISKISVPAAVVVALLAIVWGVTARQSSINRDRPASQLTAQLTSVATPLTGLVGTPITLRYLDDLKICVRDHPAVWVAVLPDNPSLYMIMGWRNPFPIDWMLPTDYVGSGARLIESARALNLTGNYLVIFQTFPASTLSTTTPSEYSAEAAQVAADPNMTVRYAPGVLQQIRDQLHGTAFGCGAFIAIHSSPALRG
jgi:hypothetical protein